MRVIIVLLLLGGAAIFGLYQFGGFSSFDPDQQGQDARKAITPGMTLAQVVGVAGNPNEYKQILMTRKKVDGVEIEFFKPGAAVKFDLGRVQDRILRNELVHGFVTPFVFSRAIAFNVEFDGSGAVVAVTDAITEADLLQMKDR